MRKLFALLPVLLLLCVSSAVAETYVPIPETPAPVRAHTEQFATPEPPPVLDLSTDPDLLDSVRFRLDAKYLHIWFPNIANEDEAILMYDGEVWLIDCADTNGSIRGVSLMKKLGISRINLLINSHPHHDHLDGLRHTAEAIPIDRLLICFPEDVNKTMRNAIKTAKEHSIHVESYTDGDILTMGDGKVSVRFMLPDYPGVDLNSQSALALVQYGNRRILFAADLKLNGETAILSQYTAEDLHADILKYPHHGKEILLYAFSDAVSPSLTVITNLQREGWEGVRFLASRNIAAMYTSTNGYYCHLYTDGNVWITEYVPLNFSEAQ